MPISTVSATEASRSFSEILNRVYYQHQVFDIKRGKEIIAKIVPTEKKPLSSLRVKDLSDFFNHLPTLADEDKKELSNTLTDIRKKLPEKKRLWD